MKKTSLVIAAIAALTLCGCGKSETSALVSAASGANGTADSASSAVESSGELSAEPAESVPGVEIPFLKGIAGDVVKSSEITTVYTLDGNDCAPESLVRENFDEVTCEGFTYAAEPSKQARNSIDNSDVFDSGAAEFSDMPGAKVSDYRRVNVGDTICGLKLVSAQTRFSSESAEDGSYFRATDSAVFEGEKTMRGYIYRVKEDEYGVAAGDIYFFPCDGEADIPVMNYSYDKDNGYYHSTETGSAANITFSNEIGQIYLGNANDITADISVIPEDGTAVKALVSMENFTYTSSIDAMSRISAAFKEIRFDK